MNRAAITTRIDATGMQAAQLSKELNEFVRANYHEMESIESGDYLVAIVSLDSALESLRQARAMIADVGHSVAKERIMSRLGLDVHSPTKQEALKAA